VIWSRACPFRPHFLDPRISNNFHVTNNVAKAVANNSEQSCVGQKCLHEWIHHLYPEHVLFLEIKQSDVHQLESRWRNFLLLFCLVLLTLWKATKTWEAYHLPIWPYAKSSVYVCIHTYSIIIWHRHMFANACCQSLQAAGHVKIHHPQVDRGIHKSRTRKSQTWESPNAFFTQLILKSN